MTDRHGWPQYYILLNRVPIAVDLETWAWAFGKEDRQVGRTEINERCEVSTVFLGLDHNHGRGEPLLFETMIFGGPLAGEQWRYATWDQAEQGHRKAVVQARKACAQIDALKPSQS
jgi:hypothetical protein